MDGEFRPLALLRLDIDRTAHQIDDVFRNRHAQTGSLDFADRAFTFIRLEHLRGELGAHAQTAVFYLQFIRAIPVHGVQLAQCHRDRAPLRREFVGVAD